MGKKIIIKGADFSINGMQDESLHTVISWIGFAKSNKSYIDSGYKPNANTKVKAKIAIEPSKFSSVSANRIFGEGNAVGNRFFLSLVTLSSTRGYVGNGQPADKASSAYLDGMPHIFAFSREGYQIDDSAMVSTGDGSFTIGEFNLALNACVNSAASCVTYGWVSTAETPVKFYGFEIYEAGVLVHDFIPVKMKADNSIKFYDKIDGTYHGTADGTTPLYGD